MCLGITCHLHFVRSGMCVCLGVTCHLHFWQNDQGLLCATTITWGQTPNKCRHRKLTLEQRRKFFYCFCQDLNPQLFDHVSGALPASYPSSGNWGNDNSNNSNRGNLLRTYLVAQSDELYSLNTYMYINIRIVVKNNLRTLTDKVQIGTPTHCGFEWRGGLT